MVACRGQVLINNSNSSQEDSMTYLLIAWISVSVGFVLGALWTGLCQKNKQVDEIIAGKHRESYSNAR